MNLTANGVSPAQTKTLSQFGTQVGRVWVNSSDPRYSVTERVGHFIYVVGRLGLHRKDEKRWAVVGILDIRKSSWTWLPREGPGYQEGCMCMFGDALYWFGPGDWQHRPTGDVSRFDLVLHEWSHCCSIGDRPDNRKSATAHLLEEREQFLLFGGQTVQGSMRSDLHLFHIPSRKWQRPDVKGRPPAKRWQHGSCVDRGVFYCYGGWGQTGRCVDGLYCMEFKGNTAIWSQPQTNHTMVGPLSSFKFMPFNGVLLLCGGLPRGEAKVTQYDPRKREFKEVSLTMGRNVTKLGYGIGAVEIDAGRSIALFGGSNTLNRYIVLRATS